MTPWHPITDPPPADSRVLCLLDGPRRLGIRWAEDVAEDIDADYRDSVLGWLTIDEALALIGGSA